MKLLLNNYQKYSKFILISFVVVVINFYQRGCCSRNGGKNEDQKITTNNPKQPIIECNEDLEFKFKNKSYKNYEISQTNPRRFTICGGKDGSYSIGNNKIMDFSPINFQNIQYIFYTDTAGIHKKHKIIFKEAY